MRKCLGTTQFCENSSLCKACPNFKKCKKIFEKKNYKLYARKNLDKKKFNNHEI